MATRIEKDSLGEFEVPADAYYGVQTCRAVHNFQISGLGPWPEFVDSVVEIKKAAARVHGTLGILTDEQSGSIVQAADEILSGKYRDQFVVDAFQAGAGTSHHMNVNEVIANRAVETLGAGRGDYKKVNPNDHVNYGQSTNDVIPTAIRLGGLKLALDLASTLDHLAIELGRKAGEFADVVKSGRTHLQDAVPLTLGQEFSGYAQVVRDHRRLITAAADELRALGIGGSAAGTGLNTHADYRRLIAEKLTEQLGTEVYPAENLFAAMQSMAPFVAVSSAVRNLALDLTKVANDFRLLSSGPMTGLAEIELPAVQPGSSIMPGKVNPVLAEMLNMVCFQVIGNATVVDYASQAGQLELNVMMPVIAFDLFFSLKIMANAVEAFASKCVAGITANVERCKIYGDLSLSNVTVLNPHIGYAKAAEIAKRALKEHRPLRDLVLEEGLMSAEDLDHALDLKAMAHPHDSASSKASS
jgi:fumarate hydratase, class II